MQSVKLESTVLIVIFVGTAMTYIKMTFVRKKNGQSFLLVKNQEDEEG